VRSEGAIDPEDAAELEALEAAEPVVRTEAGPGRGNGHDVDQWEDRERTDPTAGTVPADLLVFGGDTFAEAALPVREVLATDARGRPLFRRRSILAIGAARGVGKTMAAPIGLGVAASLGEPIFGIRWTRPLQVRVLDGEMATAEMQERYRSELRGRPGSAQWQLVSSDAMVRPLGALYSPEELARLMPFYQEADVIIIDSASYLLPVEDDNSVTAWKPAEDFLLMLRRMDKLVIVTFHLNAAGTKIRGTTAKEQSADLVALLRRPPDSKHEGTHFSWNWTKRRGVTAEVARDFEAWLTPEQGWELRTMDENERRVVLLDLLRAGMPVAEAAEESGLARATAYRWRSELIEAGVLGKPPGWERRQGRGKGAK
jgi:hypothetical protein